MDARNTPWRRPRAHFYGVLALLAVMALSPFGPLSVSGQAPAPAAEVPPPHDWSQDMPMKIMKPFTLAAVGDLIMKRTSGVPDDPGFQSLVKIIHDADMGFANYESNLIDLLQFKGPQQGFLGPKEIAGEVKAMGFRMVNRANNHSFDGFVDGFLSTNDILAENGIVYAGGGRNLAEARAPRFLATPKGRVGLVGMHNTTDSRGGGSPPGMMGALAATTAPGVSGGRPGVNILGLTKSIALSTDQIAALKKLRDTIYENRTQYTNILPSPAVNEPPDQVDLFGSRFRVGPKTGENVYQMNQADLLDIMRSVRAGKQYSDFMMVAMHSHQGFTEFQRLHFSEYPPQFLVTLAHTAVDNGADAFLGSGPHLLRGIEIYKGKPIFYGLGEFFNDMDNMPTGDPADEDRKPPSLNGVVDPVNYESVLTLSRFEKGKLVEVRLYPVEEGWYGPFSKRGTPMLATGATAQRILKRLQKISEPFRTKIAIEGDVGVIHIATT